MAWRRCAAVVCSCFLIIIFFSGFDTVTGVQYSVWEALRQTSKLIQGQVTFSEREVSLPSGKRYLSNMDLIHKFYAQRGFQTAWVGDTGISGQAQDLIRMLRDAQSDGLLVYHYHVDEIKWLMGQVHVESIKQGHGNPNQIANLELLLTDAFFKYTSHLLSGRLKPELYFPGMAKNARSIDLVKLLQKSLLHRKTAAILASLKPKKKPYVALSEKLQALLFLKENGGWPVIKSGPTLRKGMSDPRVVDIRSRLGLPPLAENPQKFDHHLEIAVKDFQYLHSLPQTGVVDKTVLKAMNVPIDQRLDQIRVNMQRWRNLPEDLGDRYILVNIANYHLRYVEFGESLLQMKVIVGQRYHQTPELSSRLNRIEFNPQWMVPRRIAVQKVLPKIKKDPSYLTRNRMDILARAKKGWVKVNPSTLDWSKFSTKNFPYMIRQRPGPKNAMGDVKFVFPNKYSVFLHDTPGEHYFSRRIRSFSNGCIRLEKPALLAQYVLRRQPNFRADDMETLLESDKTKVVKVRENVNVHILYWTVEVDLDGRVRFLTDVYGRDKKRLAKMRGESEKLANAVKKKRQSKQAKKGK